MKEGLSMEVSHPRMPEFFLFLLLLLSFFNVSKAQQAYVKNHQLDCDDNDPSTKGYVCNGIQKSCQAYITFRSNPPYTSPATISQLLGVQNAANLIASINNISTNAATIPTNRQVVVPLNCSCYNGLYYQHNASYRIKDEFENYYTLANNTYQGLTTCQALTEQNRYDTRNLYAGLDINVPLRCACPTANQTAMGAKYMITYTVTWGEYIELIAELFNATAQSVFDANGLSEESIIYPFNPILVPINSEPFEIELPVTPPPPPRTPQLELVPVRGSSKSSRKFVIVGVGIGSALLFLIALIGFLFWYFGRCWSQQKSDLVPIHEDENKHPSFSSGGLEYAIDSLVVYKFRDILTATCNFNEENMINGSVYKGTFNGDSAAVKLMTGDVSEEINKFKKINHANIIRLSGFCVHEGKTYLVYEFAENGSLDNWIWLHSKKHQTCFTLSWRQRLQISCDVADALNYLHNYTDPPFVHKNLKASNILLDGDFRAKIGNFGLARTLANEEDDNQGVQQFTQHVVGTHGHMSPEYIENGLITPKLDVFAFGVVVLELISGKEAVMREENGIEVMLFALICQVLEGDNVREKLQGFIDPSLDHEFPLHVAFSMSQLAKSCVASDPNARPTMSEVSMNLSKILSSSME